MGVKGWQELSLSANEEHLDQVAVQIHVLNWIATIAEKFFTKRSGIAVQQTYPASKRRRKNKKDPDGAVIQTL